MITAVILVAAAALAAFLAWRFVQNYRAATGTRWERTLAAAKDSATVLWSYIVMAGGYLLTFTVNAADAFNLPDVRTWIQGHLTAEMFGIALVTVALVSFFARMRTL